MKGMCKLMNVLGNSNCIMHIISNVLKMQNPKLLDHGSRVGYLVAKMMEIQEESKKDILESYMLGLLHDVGAYKTEEIDQLLLFETERVFEHSVYGYLIMKVSEVMENKVDAILHHHTPWKQLVKMNVQNSQLANLIFLADRVEIYIRTLNKHITAEILEKMDCFSKENIDLFCRADEKFNFQRRLLDGSYINDTERYLYQASFSEEEMKKIIRMIAFLIDFRSECTVTHTITMVSTAVSLGNLMNLDKQKIDEIYTGAYIHDLGKIAIPLEVLEKPGKLDYDEMEIMKTHVILTGNIISGHVSDNVYKIAMRHHEKLDGKGYPYGIGEEDMSLEEKIVAVADIFSALTGKRSYKDIMPKDKVVSIMQQMAEHHQIAKEVVKILIDNYETVEDLVHKNCSMIIHNYETIKKNYHIISKMIS